MIVDQVFQVPHHNLDNRTGKLALFSRNWILQNDHLRVLDRGLQKHIVVEFVAHSSKKFTWKTARNVSKTAGSISQLQKLCVSLVCSNYPGNNHWKNLEKAWRHPLPSAATDSVSPDSSLANSSIICRCLCVMFLKQSQKSLPEFHPHPSAQTRDSTHNCSTKTEISRVSKMPMRSSQNLIRHLHWDDHIDLHILVTIMSWVEHPYTCHKQKSCQKGWKGRQKYSLHL